MNKQNSSDPHHSTTDDGNSKQTGEAQSNASEASRAHTRSRRSRRKKPSGYKARFESLKARLQTTLGAVDEDLLKRILIACGVAAVLVVAVVVLIKSIPVGLAILVILGLAVAVRLLEELRRWPIGPAAL